MCLCVSCMCGCVVADMYEMMRFKCVQVCVVARGCGCGCGCAFSIFPETMLCVSFGR